jgi:metal-responsive CopG/Arc/MetJ family transcriptional regulator
MKDNHLSLRIEKDLLEMIDKESKKLGVSRGFVIRQIIRKKLGGKKIMKNFKIKIEETKNKNKCE